MTTPIHLDPDYALFCEEQLGDPYPFYHRLRTEDPVHWSEHLGMWLVTRYDDVNAGIRDARFSTSRDGMYRRPLPQDMQIKAKPLLEHLSHWLLLVDGSDHTRLRKLVNLAFTPRMIKSLEPEIEQITESLLDDLPRGEPIDLIKTFCCELPVAVIARMLGVPDEDRETFRIVVEKISSFSARGGPELAKYLDQALEGLREAIALFDPLIEQRRREPKEDLISALIAVEDEGEKLSQEELYAFCVFLYVAGHDTTMSIIGNGLLALLRHPDQFELLKEDVEGRIGPAMEEFLRYDGSVPRAVRQAREQVEIRGKTIKQGDTVVFLLSSANRDPEQFSDPDRIDITRHPNRHLAFGFGKHFCLGGPLARVEMQIAFRAIIRRGLMIQLTNEQPTWRPGMGVRGLESLPVILTDASLQTTQ